MTTKVLDLNNIERKFFWVLLAMFGVLVAFYMYSILSITINGVEREQMTRTIRTLALTAGDLETEYFTVQNSITLARAESLGLKEVTPRYTETDTSLKLSMMR